MQVPAATIVTVVPLTVHTGVMSEMKLTVSPDDAVALTVNGAEPYVLFASAPKVIAWLVCANAEETPRSDTPTASNSGVTIVCSAVAARTSAHARHVVAINPAQRMVDRMMQRARCAKTPPLATARIIDEIDYALEIPRPNQPNG
ncbi:MAG TPA: hypothetical protein VGK75_19870 [Casimicrobiaceae bacterium]